MKRCISIFLASTALCHATPLPSDNYQQNECKVIVEPQWRDLQKNPAKDKEFGGKWILIGNITFKKRCKEQSCLRQMKLSWKGNHIDNMMGSLYKKIRDKSFLPIEDNLICDGAWNAKDQSLILNFNKEENLGPTTIYCLVLTIPDSLEKTMRNGQFILEKECLPDQFKQTLDDETLRLSVDSESISGKP